MKLWLATAAVLLVAGAAVAVLLVDPGVWRSDAHRPMRTTIHVVNQDPQGHAQQRQRHARPTPRFALQRAPHDLPVHVEFAPANEPRAGILFDVHTGRVLWQHDPGRSEE